MDTAQRGMGLDWPVTGELITRTGAEARAVNGALVVGVGTDHLSQSPSTLTGVADAYLRQLDVALDAGAIPVLMASRHLAALAATPDDYEYVYDRVLTQIDGMALLHWLGPEFDKALTGYWGSTNVEEAMAVCLRVVKSHAAKLDGIKLSLLDAAQERRMRRELPSDVRMYTGDDFHYVELIRGDESGHSDALLGIFGAIAPAAATALRALDVGNFELYHAALDPTVALARHIFSPPIHLYKVGIAFLAYLTGHQRQFCMLGGWQDKRSRAHLARVAVLADAAGLIPDPEVAAKRLQEWLSSAKGNVERGPVQL